MDYRVALLLLALGFVLHFWVLPGLSVRIGWRSPRRRELPPRSGR